MTPCGRTRSAAAINPEAVHRVLHQPVESATQAAVQGDLSLAGALQFLPLEAKGTGVDDLADRRDGPPIVASIKAARVRR